MNFHFQQGIRALILLAFSTMLFKLHLTGEITMYINPKYETLSQVAAVLFIILFLIQTTRIWSVKDLSHHHCDHDDHSCTHDHGYATFNPKKMVSYVIIVIPLVSGFFLPPKVLDSAIASKKGGMAILSNQQKAGQGSNIPLEQNVDTDTDSNVEEEIISNEILEHPPEIENQDTISSKEYEQLIKNLEQGSDIQMDDYVYNAYYEEISKDINKFIGRKINLKGFIYKEEGFSQEQLVISRFLITHCVADASIIGFLAEFSEASTLEMDTWIEAEGVIEMTNYNGAELPVIKITNWKKTNEPEEPYLYPINVKIF